MNRRLLALTVAVLGTCVTLASAAGAARSPATSFEAAGARPALSFTQPSGVSRRPSLATAPTVIAANSTTYQDSVGEDPAAPDITTIAVSNDDAANISFRVNVPNRPQYSQDIAIVLLIDSDANQATGDPQSLGADHRLQVMQGRAELVRWNGSDYASTASSPSYTWSGGPTIRINAANLNNTRRLLFDVTAISGAAFDSTGALDCTNCKRDFAPAVGFYRYEVRVSSQPSPRPPPAEPPKTYRDAPSLPARLRYVGASIKHVRLGENLYDTMRTLSKAGLIRVPRVVAVACWSATDWSSVAASVGFDGNASFLFGFWLPRQPRWLHLNPTTCGDVQALISTRHANGRRAYALATILHERVHAERVVNEAQTNCYAVQLVHEFASELNFVPVKARRLEQLAVRTSRALAPRRYWNAVNCRDGGKWDLYPQVRNLSY
jgi:hypothetical protein